MKGSVINIMLTSLKRTYGEELVDAARKQSGVIQKEVEPSANVESKDMAALIKEISQMTNQDMDLTWRKLGRENAKSFQNWFPSYFKQKSFKRFLILVDKIHINLTKLLPGADPPSVTIKEVDNRTIQITYRSKRNLISYFLGELEGCSEIFGEKIVIDEKERGMDASGKGYLVANLIFEKPDYEFKKYPMSILFSFGFLKTLPVKTAVNSFLLIFLTDLIINKDILLSAAHSGIVSGIIFILVRFFTSPSKDAIGEFARLAEKDFTHDMRVQTNDVYENSFKTIGKVRTQMSEDLILIKGFVDDLKNFGGKFSTTSHQMTERADNISESVSDVSAGSTQLATDTEEIVSIIKQNVDSLEEMEEENLQKKENIVGLVSLVQENFSGLHLISEDLNSIRNSFGEVNKRGQELANSVRDTMEIVNVVEKIAEQTNLLSLNASIEAARVGEAGKGFAVVANQIRNLVESSKKSANDINEKLEAYGDDVRTLIEGITDQYERLSSGIGKLTDMSEKNEYVMGKIGEIAEFIEDVVGKIHSEIDSVNQLSINIESIAAVGQENAAAVAMISSQIEDFAEDIHILKEYSQELYNMHDIMKENLEGYRF